MNGINLTSLSLCSLLLLSCYITGSHQEEHGSGGESEELEFGTEDVGGASKGAAGSTGLFGLGMGLGQTKDSPRGGQAEMGGGYGNGKGEGDKKGGLGGILGGLGGGLLSGLPGMSNLMSGTGKGGVEATGQEGKNSTGDGSVKPMNDWAKLILNPVELVKAIGEFYKIPFDKFIEKIGTVIIFGTEVMLSPVVVSLKIIEKIFVPDACRLKFVCKIGGYLTIFKEPVLKFSPTFLEGSAQLKALTDGIVGRDCETAFTCGGGEPKLKKPFEQLRGADNKYEAAASNNSKQQLEANKLAAANQVAGASNQVNKIVKA